MSLIIETGRLRLKPEKISGEEPAEALEFDLNEFTRPAGPLTYALTAQRIARELVVRGSLKINFTFRCGRCGDTFNRKVTISDFCRNFELAIQNEAVNLLPDVREDILLALPITAVCSDGCRGLCAGCRVNLNRGKCRCKRRKGVDGWQILDSLRLQ